MPTRRQYKRVGNGAPASLETEARVGIAPRCYSVECAEVPKPVGRVLSCVALVCFIVWIWPCASQDMRTLPCALLLVFVLLHFMPVALAFFITRLLQVLSWSARPPLTIGALHMHSWIRTGSLHMRVVVEEGMIRNPDGKFSDECFLEFQHLSLHCHIGFGTIWNFICGGCCSLSSPRSWTRGNSRRRGLSPGAETTTEVSSPRPIGLIYVDHIEVNNIRLNLETAVTDGELNLCAFKRLSDARRLAKALPSDQDHPARLVVDVLKVRNLPAAAQRISLDVRGQEEVLAARLSSPSKAQPMKSGRRQSSPSSPSSPREVAIGESFEFLVEHESAVLHVETRSNAGSGEQRGQEGLVGQWVVPLLDLATNPNSLRHSVGTLNIDAETGHVEGWFPFRDGRFREEGSCGEIQLKLQWAPLPSAEVETTDDGQEPSGDSSSPNEGGSPLETTAPAIEQIGIMLRDQRARNNGFNPIGFIQDLPIRLLCDRITFRNLMLNVGALIPDEDTYQQRRFSSASGRYNGLVPIKHLEASGRDLRPRREEGQGLSIFQLAIKAGASLGPEVLKVSELKDIFGYLAEEGLLTPNSLAQSGQDDGGNPWWAAQE